MSIVRFVVVLLFFVALPLAGQSTGVRVSQSAIFEYEDAVLETSDGRTLYVSQDGLVEFEEFSFQLFPDGPEIQERLNELGLERWFYPGRYEYLVYGDFLALEMLADSIGGGQPTYFLLANDAEDNVVLYEAGAARFAAYDGIILVIQSFHVRAFDTATNRFTWNHTWRSDENELESLSWIGKTDIDEGGVRLTLRNGTRLFFDWTSGLASCP